MTGWLAAPETEVLRPPVILRTDLEKLYGRR